MLRRAAAAAVIAAGCYAPYAPTNVRCNPAAPVCPSGESCRSVGGAFVCTTAGSDVDGGIVTPEDRDGDGIENALDNCIDVANQNQADEDKDTRGDLCDNCPPWENSDQLDGDKDGVGEDCDPYPMVAGDRILVFEGFAGGIPATWTRLGTWTAATGTVTAQAGDTPAALFPPVTTTVHQYLATSVDVISVAGAVSAVGVVDQVPIVGGAGVVCAAARTAGNQPVVGLFDGSSSFIYASRPLPFQAGSAYELSIFREYSYHDCEADPEVGDPVLVERDPLVPAVTGPNLGPVVVRATARFHWFMAVTSPP